MSSEKRWICHRTDRGAVWSPLHLDAETVTKVGPEPETSQLSSIDPISIEDVDILPPAEPRKVVALAKNRKSIDDAVLIFLMTPSCVIGNGDAIQLPYAARKTWSEGELAFIISEKARDVPPNEAADYILGYTVANDVTSEHPAGRDLHLPRAKAHDTFCPVGSYLMTELDTTDLAVTTRVNGTITLQSSTKEYKMNEYEALAEISSLMTLNQGDIILAGAPASPNGSYITPGDTTAVEIEGIGELTNPVESR